MISTPKLERVAGQLRGLGSRGKALLKPPPIHFGAPRQLAPEPAVSWWYVPVFIEPSAMHQKMLDDCSIFLLPLSGAGQPLRLRWRGSQSPVTVEHLTLLENQLYLVPIAARKEGVEGGRAIITTSAFLTERKVKWSTPAGRSHWKLRAESAGRRWDSPHAYVLNVPGAGASNGHFTLEQAYERFE